MVAASTGGILVTMSGMHPRTGRFYVYNEMCGGGMGAGAGQDGLNAVQVNTTNTANLPVEALESEHPVMVECYELVQNSGGAGEFRGGMTMRRRIRVLDHTATANVGGSNNVIPPWGLAGGEPGLTCRVERGEGVAPLVRRNGMVAASQTIATIGAADGGYGDPKKRDRGAVRRDLREGRISAEAAAAIYGLAP